MKIAITGKGGVGKTTVSALIINALAERGRKVLAIDSDPSPHLARALGFPEAHKICPLAEMEELLRERSGREGAFYQLNPKVDDLPEKFMLRHGNIHLMVLGAIQKGGAGCACAENAVLRNLLNLLILEPQQDIVLDMEAGVEHLGRGTIAAVDYILIVVQPYLGSLKTAQKILKLCQDLKIAKIGIVANNVSDPDDVEYIKEIMGTPPLGIFYSSGAIKKAERRGEPINQADKNLREAAQKVLKKVEQLNG